MKWYKATSKTKPAETEINISNSFNYIRKNIVEKVIEDETTGIMGKIYEYEECKISKEDWGFVLDLIKLTPYTETKTAYIDDTEIIFENVPNGNLTVYVKDSEGMYLYCTAERVGDMIKVYFEPLEYIATVTISIL